MRFRSRLSLLVAVVTAAFAALAPPARALVGDSPCAIATSTGPISPISGQPSDIVVIGPSGSQGVAVWRRFGADSVCAGAALPQNARKWRALIVDSTGAVATVNNQASRAAAVAIVWTRTSVQAPASVPPTDTAVPPPGDSAGPPRFPLDSASLADLFGAPIRRVGDTTALPPALAAAVAEYDAKIGPILDAQWASAQLQFGNGAWWEATTYYDRALLYYWLWARTGNPEYLRRGHAQALSYRGYLERATPLYGAPAHWSMLKGLALHYRLTGDEASRTAIVRNAEVLAGVLPEYYTPGGSDARILSKMIVGSVLAWELTKNGTDLPPDTWPRNWAQHIDFLLTRARAWQAVNGSYPQAITCWGQMNYQIGMLNDALIFAHTRYRADTAIVTQVRRGVDYQWSTQWRGAEGAFQYMDVSCPNVGGLELTGDLTGLIVSPWPWLARITGEAKYRAQGAEIFVGLVRNAYLVPTKQTNQAYAESPKFLGWW